MKMKVQKQKITHKGTRIGNFAKIALPRHHKDAVRTRQYDKYRVRDSPVSKDKAQRTNKPRGMEEHIEGVMQSSSIDEIDSGQIDMGTSSCCASDSCDDNSTRTATKLSAPQAFLHKVFSVLNLYTYANFVRSNTALTVVSAILLAISAFTKNFFVQVAANSGFASRIAQASLFSVYAILGVPALIDLANNLAALKINIHVLTMLAVFSTVLLGSPLEGGLLLLLFETAHIIEERLTNAAKGDLGSLFKSSPKIATVVDVSQTDMQPLMATERDVRVEDVQVGQHVLVKAGDMFPLDGVVVHGFSLVTSENITGEALPHRKSVGQSVPAGARSVDGTFVIKTTKSVEESTPMRIARMTSAAQARKPVIKRTLDQYVDVYSKGVLVCTLAITVLLPLFKVPVLGLSGSMYRAAAFLTAAAPCALVLSPLAYVAAISAIARKGVIVRGGLVLDKLANCDTIAMDKTGTLTEGQLQCVGISRLEKESECMDPKMDAESLKYAVALSQMSTHPVSKAIKEFASDTLHDNNVKIEDFRMIPGCGVEGMAFQNGGGKQLVKFGSIDYISKNLDQSVSADLERAVEQLGQDKVVSVLHKSFEGPKTNGNGHTTAEHDNDKEFTALFIFKDRIKEKSASSVEQLKDSSGKKLQVMMLTGDHASNANTVAKQLNISHVYAGLLPEEKLSMLEKARGDISNTGVVAMVGDGINDAPALAAADVGIAFANTTSDAAASASDAIILQEGGDHISVLPYLFKIAHRTKHIIKQNLVLATLSIVGTSLPSVGGYIPLWLSVCMHEGSTVLVALNSLKCLLPEFPVRKYLGPLAFMVLGLGGICTGAFRMATALDFSSLVLILESASAGIFAGALHSLTGPDHLAALAPLSIGRTHLTAGFLGGLWGFGHSVGQFFFGACFVLLKSKFQIHLDIIEHFAGAAIGATLMFIGFVGYKEAKSFAFDQDQESKPAVSEKRFSKFTLATFGTGFLHGLSPDAILPILPALTLSTRACAFAFVIAFVVGTVGSMASYTAFIGVGSSALAQKSPTLTKKISMGSSFVALGLGVALIICSILGVDLFSLASFKLV